MIRIKDNRYGIRQQVLLITLLPLVIMTLILAGYFVSTRIADNQAALIERGQTMSRLMAEASEFGLISGLTHQLSALSQGPIQEPDVADVIFINSSKQILYRAQQFELDLALEPDPLHKRSGQHWLFYTPVLSQGVLIQDSPEYNSNQPEKELLGWVVVALSTKPMNDRENQIISNSLMILLAGFLITFVIAARFAETLSKPVIELTGVVKRLEEGDLSARTSVQSSAELGQLEKGINLLGAQVQSSNQVLESQVDKATQRLRKTLHHLETQNIALQRARQRADQANLAKDEFLARMSHELRTPLTSVLGFTGMLQQTDLNLEQVEYCRIINQTSSMLLSIIDDILDFAKLQSDAIRLEQIQFNPEQVIYEAIEMQSQSIATKGLELAFIVDSTVAHSVLGDPTRLRQVATNLISNAIKFTDSGQIIIKLNNLNEFENQSTLELSVEDSGIGIAEEQQEHLFNAFSQADSTITRRFGGTGLGLVIVQKLIQLMQGKISLQSTPNQGTRIACTFMVKKDTRGPAIPSVPASGSELVIFDRHPETLKAISQLAGTMAGQIHSCATLPSLHATLSTLSTQNAGLIFGLSANPDIANQQKLKMREIFNSFNGNILLLTPTLGNQLPDLNELRQQQRLTVAAKPLHRNFLNNWILQQPLEQRVTDTSQNHMTLPEKYKVLIAEDNDFNRLLLRKIVETAGGEVIEARNGQQAVELARQLTPQAILMDVHMPVMDGISATRILRQELPSLPIVALTANVISSEEHELRQAGISRIEYKPVNDKKLIQLLRLLSQSDKKQQRLPRQDDDKLHQPATRLSHYQLSQADLHKELIRLLRQLENAFRADDLMAIRDSNHQLLGLAGLFELPELESCSNELHDAIESKNKKELWQHIWRLQRIIQHHQYSDD